MTRVLTCYYRFKPGGFCQRLVRAMQVLLDKGCEVHYVSLERFPLTHRNCYHHRFPWPIKYSNNLLFWSIFHLLAPLQLAYLGIRIRATHLFCFGANYALLLQPIRSFARIPLTLFLRGDAISHHRMEGRPNSIIAVDLLLEGMALRGARVYGASSALRDRVIGRHTRFKPLQSGVLPNEIAKASPPRTPSPSGAVRFACVGTFDRQKNHETIVRAFQSLGTADNCELHMFGEGPHKVRLQRLTTELALENTVQFHGWVERDKMWKKVDVLLFPSLYEGSPNAVLEAISEGIPVIASDIPEHREMLPPEFLVPPREVDTWRRWIVKIEQSRATLPENIASKQNQFAGKFRFDWNSRVADLILASNSD